MKTDIERLISLGEFNDFKNVQDFFRVLINYDYRVVGGLAVAYYVKERIPTRGDIDVLISVDEYDYVAEDLCEEGWKVFGKGLREVFEYAEANRGGDKFDILIDDLGIIERCSYRKAVLRELVIKIIEPEWLIPLKLMASRDKDIQDIFFLLQSGGCDEKKIEKAVMDFVGKDGLRELEALKYMAKIGSKFEKDDLRKD